MQCCLFLMVPPGIYGQGNLPCEAHCEYTTDQFQTSLTYEDLDHTWVKELTSTSDDGYAVVGEINNIPGQENRFVLTKLEEDGSYDWSKAYTPFGFPQIPNEVTIEQVIETNDQLSGSPSTGYLIIGREHASIDPSIATCHWLLLKTDATGNVEWAKKSDFGPTQGTWWGQSTILQAVVQTDDFGYLMAGTLRLANGTSCLVVMKLSWDGSVIEYRQAYRMTNSGSGRMQVDDINATPDGGFVVSGQYDIDNNVSPTRPFLLKLKADYTTQFFSRYEKSGSAWDMASSPLYVEPLANGNLVFTSRFADRALPELITVVDGSTGAHILTKSISKPMGSFADELCITQIEENGTGDLDFVGYFIDQSGTPKGSVLGSIDNQWNVTSHGLFPHAQEHGAFGYWERMTPAHGGGYAFISRSLDRSYVAKTNSNLDFDCSTPYTWITEEESVSKEDVNYGLEPVGGLLELGVTALPHKLTQTCVCAETQYCVDDRRLACGGVAPFSISVDIVQGGCGKFSFTENSVNNDPNLEIVDWNWAFDNVASKSGQHVKFEYGAQGTRAVCLTLAVKDLTTNTTCEYEHCFSVEVDCNSCDAGNPTSLSMGLGIGVNGEFVLTGYGTAASGWTIESWLWDLGDGTYMEGQSVSHEYDCTPSILLPLSMLSHEICLTVILRNTTTNEVCMAEICRIYDCNGIDITPGSGMVPPEATGISDAELESSIQLYPAIVHSNGAVQLEITADKTGEVAYQLIGVDGKLYRSGRLNVDSGHQKTEISVSSLPTGSYFLEMSLEGNRHRFTFVVIP